MIPTPGPNTGMPYQPTALVSGGVVVTLFPPDSPYLNQARIMEPEIYSGSVPGRVGGITNVHNPSIEFHRADKNLNTGVCIIMAAGGGHQNIGVGFEGIDFIPFFFSYGINTVILRNRLQSSGYSSKTDERYDALQAIRMVRAHAQEWGLDPHKIGIMGFSAGAELAAAAAVYYPGWDANNNKPEDPLAGITARPDFVGDIYPGPSPFSERGTDVTVPPDAPPSFIVCAGSGDSQHAGWADDYFRAMLEAQIPNIEMHIYAIGAHPGSLITYDGYNDTNGMTDRHGAPYGTWQYRFLDWFRSLGFLDKPGVPTRAAIESDLHVHPPARGAGRGGRGGAPVGDPGAGAPSAPAAPAAQ
jgi:endo-1,4-beta-xylanase